MKPGEHDPAETLPLFVVLRSQLPSVTAPQAAAAHVSVTFVHTALLHE